MRKTKLLTSLMAVGACGGLVMPLITTATSCSCSSAKDYTALANLLGNEAIDIFKETVCSKRHKSYHCKDILGVYKDYVETRLGEGSFITDNYQDDWKTAHPGEETPWESDQVYANAYFDIPASKGCENWERMIFQGHYDMVEDGFTTETTINVEESTKNGRKILHVKDDATSLGADNGVGIALMLALLNKRDEFTHGPIRCMFIADEEPGMVGAGYVPESWIDGKYLLNIDNENEGDLVKSCAGGYSMNYHADTVATADQTTTTTDGVKNHVLKFSLSGLKGGHSADVTPNVANAIKEMNKFLNKYYAADDDVKLIKFTSPTTDIDATNTVPVTAEAEVATKKDWDQTLCNQYAAAFQAEIREKYSEEKNAIFTITKKLDTEVTGTEKCLTTVRTKNFYDCIDALKFGPISYLDKEKTILESSSNVGPICVDLNSTLAKGYSPVMVKFYSRSCNNNVMDLIKAYNEKACKKLTDNFTSGSVAARTLAEFPGWAPDDQNQLIDWCVEHFNQLGIKSTVSIIHGGVEPAWWVNKKPGLITTSIGPTIVGPHKKGEHVYLDTYYNMTKVVLYVLDKMAK